MTITHLFRYPFKGLSGEFLQNISLTAGETIPLDRKYALAHQTTVFDPNNPKHLPKTDFVMLMKNEKLAALSTRFQQGELIIEKPNDFLISAHLENIDERRRLERFFKDYLGDEIRGEPRIVEANNHSFSDVAAKVLSFVNLNSIKDLEQKMNATIHPLRFRANVYFEGLSAWEELHWENKTFQIGSARFKWLKNTTRCLATNVNPETAERDLEIPQALLKHYGHNCLGFYLQVIDGGTIGIGNQLTIL
ncbi:MAG: putative sulfurase C-terminal domain [Pseudomonadota bacterium]|jgi:uncharacterized protein YcbX